MPFFKFSMFFHVERKNSNFKNRWLIEISCINIGTAIGFQELIFPNVYEHQKRFKNKNRKHSKNHMLKKNRIKNGFLRENLSYEKDSFVQHFIKATKRPSIVKHHFYPR